MELSEILYSTLLEDENNTEGWDKKTIDYCINNKKKILNTIRLIGRKNLRTNIHKYDIDDIYMELIRYFYKSDDYNIEKARSSIDGNIISLEIYVNSCIKFCVKRYSTHYYETHKDTICEFIKDSDGEELSVFNKVKDKSKELEFENITVDLDSVLKSFESQRYKYGNDIFQIWFIRLFTTFKQKDYLFKDILSVLNYTKADIEAVENSLMYNNVMIEIAKAVSKIGIEDSIDIFKKYTYSTDRIINLVEVM